MRANFATSAFTAAGVFAILPYSRTSPRKPASASATAIVSLCTSSPTYVITCFKARLLCMRLGTGHPGATLVSLHTVRRVAPISGEHLVWHASGISYRYITVERNGLAHAHPRQNSANPLITGATGPS